jgi:hypothetical protein
MDTTGLLARAYLADVVGELALEKGLGVHPAHPQ